MANNAELVAQCRAKAQEWLSPSFDEKTRAEVQALLDKEDPSDLIDAFYQNLEFGTGGLRGTMGVGTNRMNKYIVAMATQGFANYVLKSFPGRKDLAAVVGHDCRNNGRDYAETVAAIFTANGIKAYLFESLRPTPEISFAIRQLGAQCGVNVTASHNPKEYNGYKAYWEDGAQVLMPHDTAIVEEVKKVKIEDVKWDLNPDLLQIIGGEMDFDYMQAVKEGMVDQDVILRNKDLNIVYSAMHGTGRVLVPLCLRSWGFQNINVVPEQMVVDGNFPTVVSPNPENPEAMTLGLKLGTKLNADLVMLTSWLLPTQMQTVSLSYAVMVRASGRFSTETRPLVCSTGTPSRTRRLSDSSNHLTSWLRPSLPLSLSLRLQRQMALSASMNIQASSGLHTAFV